MKNYLERTKLVYFFLQVFYFKSISIQAAHRRRINTEEKAKFVASGGGGGEEEFIKFLAALAVLFWTQRCIMGIQ